MMTLHISGAEGKSGEERDHPQVTQSTRTDPQQAFSILREVTSLWERFFQDWKLCQVGLGKV